MFGAIAAVMINQARRDQENDDEIEGQNIRLIKKNLRDTSNPFELDPLYFKRHYRLTSHVARQLINMLQNYVPPQRESAIPFHMQVLAVLRFFAEGSYQKGVSNDFNHPMSQSSISRHVERIVNGILMLKNRYIQIPITRESRQLISDRFRRYIRIPNVIGLIDCFLVTCKRPTENEEAFYNYKVGSSMNVQVVTDLDYIIQSISICPGSNNDKFIWNQSNVKMYLETLRTDDEILRNEGKYYLLGDSGYTPSTILLTPIENAQEGSAEAAYTNEHVSTRCKVEQTFGVLTNVWRAINRARKLSYEPTKVAKIILACAILHNYRLLNGGRDEIEINEVVFPLNNNYEDDYAAGVRERDEIVRQCYNI